MAPLTLERHAPLDLVRLGALFEREDELRMLAPTCRWPFDKWEWTEWLCASGVTAYFVMLKGQTVGHFGFRTFVPDRRHLSWLYLAPAARGGRGRELLGLAERAARAYGVNCMTLNVLKVNARARYVYEACGYVEIEHSPDKIFMRKDLI